VCGGGKMMKQLTFLILVLMMVSSVSAFTIISSSRIDFDSNNPDLAKPAFVLNTIENGGSQYVQYTLPLSNLEGSLPQGYELQGVGEIRSQVTDYRVTWGVQLAQPLKPIFELQEIGSKFYLFRSDADNWCQGIGGVLANKNYGFSNYDCFGVEIYGYLSDLNPSYTTRFTNTITVLANGQTATVQVSESVVTGQTILPGQPIKDNNNRVQVKFLSLAGSPNAIPSLHTERSAMYSTQTNTWRMITKISNVNYNQFYSLSGMQKQMADCVLLRGNRQLESSDYCSQQVNQNVVSTFSSMPFTGSTISSVEGTNGEVVLRPAQAYTYPKMQLIIDADWVGIFRPTGNPQIRGIEKEEEYVEGTDITITSTVRNTANVPATFAYDINCPSPFIARPINLQDFKAGETRSVVHPITAETTSRDTVTCTFTVRDYENPSVSVSTPFDLTVVSSTTCSPLGRQRCLLNDIQQCQEENGVLVWKQLASCLNSCIPPDERGYAQCSELVNQVPICGNNICQARENIQGDVYYCPEDCPPVKPATITDTTLVFIIIGVLATIILITAIVLRLKKEGYLK
jgi:hypothetical protein